MQITHSQTRTRTLRRFTVEDGPVLPQPYSSAGRRFRVERVTLEYTLDGTFGDWTFAAAQVGGTVLKKDGTDSANQHDSSVYSYDIRDRKSRWGWLAQAIDTFRPTGTADYPVRSFSVEVDDLESGE